MIITPIFFGSGSGAAKYYKLLSQELISQNNSVFIVSDQELPISKDAVEENKLTIQMGFAAEIRFDPIIIDMVNNNSLPLLGEYENEKLILLEFPHSHIPAGCEELIKWLANKGIRVLIAHPERNRSVLKNIETLTPLIKLGCLLQVTGGSLTGVFNDAAKECAIELLKRDWVTIIASDAHNIHARCPELESSRKVAVSIVGEEAANQMVFDIPDMISKVHFVKKAYG